MIRCATCLIVLVALHVGCGSAETDEQAPEPVIGIQPGEREPIPPTRYVNSVGMTLIPLQPGTFLMGSPLEEEDRDWRNEWPVHEVTLTRGFWMSAHEVTNAQYRQFASDYVALKCSGKPIGEYEPNPDGSIPFNGPNEPVVAVTWHEAVAFCKWLSEKEGCTYRLPTEAQWEYACRAGTRTRYYFGEDAAELGKYEWYRANSEERTHPVGTSAVSSWIVSRQP